MSTWFWLIAQDLIQSILSFIKLVVLELYSKPGTLLILSSQWSSVSVYLLCLRTVSLIFKGDGDVGMHFFYPSNSLAYSIFTSLQCWFVCDFM